MWSPRSRRSRRSRAQARSLSASPSIAPRRPLPCLTSSERLDRSGVEAPLIGDFHYNGHTLLDGASGLRRGARQVSHQSRQCRLQGQARQAILRDRGDRAPSRQGGAHRGELGKPRSGSAHAAHGREREIARAQGRARGDARSDRAIGGAERGSRDGARARGRSDRALGKGQRRAGPDRGLLDACRPFRACAPSRADRGGDGVQGHRRVFGRARRAASAGDRRHHPHLAHARARTATGRWK